MEINTIILNDKKYVLVEEERYQQMLALISDHHPSAEEPSYLPANEERLPHEMVKRLCAENPLRVWREYRGFSGRQLATAAGISPAYLSDIETGRKDGSIAVLKRLAALLRVDVDDII